MSHIKSIKRKTYSSGWKKKVWFSVLLVNTGHLWKRGSLLAVRPLGKFHSRESVCHGSGDRHTRHCGGARSVSALITIWALVDLSSRAPLQGNKREMLYTLMTFPQWLSKKQLPLNCFALVETRGESPMLIRGREILSPLSVHSARPANRGGIIRSLCGMGPTGDSLSIVPTAPSRILVWLFLWVQHMVTLQNPHKPKLVHRLPPTTSPDPSARGRPV